MNHHELVGKRILEIGGSGLPYMLTNVFLGARQWVSVDFIDWGGGYQKNFSNQKSFDKKTLYSAEEINRIDWDYDNIVIDGDANKILPEIVHDFDIVISINCFEHVDDLDTLIENIYSVLKNDGILFSVFGPIWSCAVGHHMSISNQLHFNSDNNLLAQHEHILYSKEEIITYLKENDVSEDEISMVLHKIYEKKDINRLYYRDYLKIFANSKFKEKKVWSHHILPITSSKIKEKLNKKAPDDYETYSIGIFFKK